MTIATEQQFKEADIHWDLERLLNDLAEVNGKSLTFTEQLTLRGLLCGFTPAELAEMWTKNKEGQRTNVSRGVGSYVKKLMKVKGCEVPDRMNSVEMLNMLKKAGYIVILTYCCTFRGITPLRGVLSLLAGQTHYGTTG